MKVKALQALRDKLASDRPVFGLWSTLPSPAVTAMAVDLGLDWVAIDAEHGSFDWQSIESHVRATVRSRTVLLVRVAELNIALFKRALDIGADGVAVPFINTPDELLQALSYVRYPPLGVRAVGGDRATGWGQCFSEHVHEANTNVFLLPNLETVQAAASIDSLAMVSGVDTYFFGPADFSASAGHAGQWEGPGIADALLLMKDRIRAAGKHCGLIAISLDDLRKRHEQGFRMIGVGVDAGLLIRGMQARMRLLGLSPSLNAALDPNDDPRSEETTHGD